MGFFLYNSRFITVGVGFILTVDTGKPNNLAIRVDYCQQFNFFHTKVEQIISSHGVEDTNLSALMTKLDPLSYG